MSLQTLDVHETNESGDILNSEYQTSVVLMHDSCDVRADQSFDSSLPSVRSDKPKLRWSVARIVAMNR
jgi:hypothetical protein